ncbi:MAG TPA: lipid-A-disaccharide synthase N-terminal domain-containing protein [Dyella sp.]|uniref:lipid-A-disaccharide synthase N-terminal domain-containing protein n=1 Tax=Dyella sp. TaxID=1869338 RepID=UPI002CC73007|nr:lipid-A-disaccharide synthase N-terminal domain-containing protein [Dyella sp.]HUB89341.1 lipid-A-disaccharide synthase N-terminal domain-containing protein [Dyella sp.]
MTLDHQTLWIGLGMIGQLLFGVRFLVQWLYSEARGQSLIPPAFWYLSVAGGAIVLSYAIHQREVVFIIGESVTLVIFLRNLIMLRKQPESD